MSQMAVTNEPQDRSKLSRMNGFHLIHFNVINIVLFRKLAFLH